MSIASKTNNTDTKQDYVKNLKNTLRNSISKSTSLNNKDYVKDLEDKLADIEKVISTFSEQTNLSSRSGDPFIAAKDINKAYDFTKDFTKELVQPFIETPSSSNKDRIELLIDSLKKQNLI